MFETNGLSEEELREKLTQLNQRLFSAHAMGMSYDIKVQLESMVEQIEIELQSRFALDIQRMWDEQFPDVIESEPDLRPGAVQPTKSDKKKDKVEIERPAVVPKFNKVYRK